MVLVISQLLFMYSEDVPLLLREVYLPWRIGGVNMPKS